MYCTFRQKKGEKKNSQCKDVDVPSSSPVYIDFKPELELEFEL